MVVSPAPGDLNNHTQFRVLVPYMAKPIYRVANHHTGTWDPIMFSLLVVNSLFVAATVTILLVVTDREVGSYSIGLGAALIYLLNFAVPNLRLMGFIDAGEGFFLMLLVWALLQERYWVLPLLGIVGATAKETFVPYLVVFSLVWWLSSRKTQREPRSAAVWMGTSWVAALASLAVLQWAITGVYRSPLRFGMELHENSAYLGHFFRSLADRNLWYIFFWLLPLSLFRLNRLPRNWKFAAAAASVTAFVLDAYYGGAPGTIGRTLFSVVGPLLSAAVAVLLFSDSGSATNSRDLV